MALNKVEICRGKYIQSSDPEVGRKKKHYFKRSKKEILKPANNISKEISALC